MLKNLPIHPVTIDKLFPSPKPSTFSPFYVKKIFACITMTKYWKSYLVKSLTLFYNKHSDSFQAPSPLLQSGQANKEARELPGLALMVTSHITNT